MFSFTEEMDEGNIWAVKGFHIMKDDTIDDCSKNASAIAIDLLEEHYLDILEGKTESFQQMGVPSYCAMRSPADGLIDWRKPSDSIYNFIRAQTHPYPGAFSHNEILGKVTVWESKPVDVTYYGVAGKVVKSIKDIGVYVICGDNKPLLITKVQQYDELRNNRRQTPFSWIKVDIMPDLFTELEYEGLVGISTREIQVHSLLLCLVSPIEFDLNATRCRLLAPPRISNGED